MTPLRNLKRHLQASGVALCFLMATLSFISPRSVFVTLLYHAQFSRTLQFLMTANLGKTMAKYKRGSWTKNVLDSAFQNQSNLMDGWMMDEQMDLFDLNVQGV